MRGRISQRVVDALAPGPRDQFLWDDAVPGFGVKITPRGRRIYIYQFRTGGRATPTARVTIGPNGAPWTAKTARAEAEALHSRVRSGEDPRRDVSQPPEAPARVSKRGFAADDWRLRLGFLVTDIPRLQHAALRRAIRSPGGSPAQSRLLGELSLRPGLSQSELAAALDLSKVAVSGLVNRATRAGWIEQRPDPDDRRSRRLYLTAYARRTFAAMRAEVDAVHDRAFAHIDRKEGERAIAVLEALRLGWLPLARPERVKKGA